MSARVQYKRKNTYRTKSNVVRKIRTPGGKLSIQYKNKRVQRKVCAESGKLLNGIPRQAAFNLARKQRSVTRPYGGILSAIEVQNRIKRAFFNEEMKVLKNAVNAKKSKTKAKKR